MYTVPYKCSSYLDQHELSSPLILGLSATRWNVYAHLTGHSGLCRFRSVYQNVDTRVTTQYRKGLLKCLGVQPAQFHVSHSPLRPFSSSWTLQHSSLTIGLSPCQSYVCFLRESVKTQKYRHCDKLCAARLPVSPSACPDVCKPVCPHVCCILAELGDALCMYHNCKSNTLTLHLLYPNTGCIPICWYQNVLQKINITFSTNVLAWVRRGSKMSYRQQFDGRMAVHFSSQKQYHHTVFAA